MVSFKRTLTRPTLLICFQAWLLFFFFTDILAQENNYWSQQIGVTASLLGGAVTAGINDNSAIVYNPGKLAYIENSNLSIVADIYSLESTRITNGGGPDLDIRNTRVVNNPQIVAGLVKSKKIPLAINYASLNRAHSDIRYKVRNEKLIELSENYDGEEVYKGNYEYRNIIRDDWFGVGFGYKITEDIGIGFSTFFTYRSQDFQETIETYLSSIDTVTGDYQNIATFNYKDQINQGHFGMLWVLGIALKKNNWEIGINIITPRVNLGIFSTATLNRNMSYITKDGQTEEPNYSININSAGSRYRSPWEINLGYIHTYGDNKISFRIAYYNRIKTYNMININEKKQQQSFIPPPDDSFQEIRMANKQIFNLAVGFQQQISEKTWFLYGFRTDFNYFVPEIYTKTDVIPTRTYWNQYIINFGWAYQLSKNVLTVGIGYTLGRSRGDPQFINISEPDLNNFLLGPIGNDTRTKIDQLSLIIGFVYNFNKNTD
jgi:hypothetical protein